MNLRGIFIIVALALALLFIIRIINLRNNPQPLTCTDKQGDLPVITSLSKYSGPVGTQIEIRGCNFSGFEGDVDALIENSQGTRGFLPGSPSSTNKLIIVTLNSPLCQHSTEYSGLPCESWLNLTTGTYRIYTAPFGVNSNEFNFLITN